MPERFAAIWFCYLKTDWFEIRQPILKNTAFVLASPDHGRMVITATNVLARSQGADTGMVVADARANIPGLQVLDDRPELSNKLLKGLAEWCIRYTPAVAIDEPDGLILDVTGCPHLWGGEKLYLENIITRLKSLGYSIRAAIADTIGTAWATVRFGKNSSIIESGGQAAALVSLPAKALRIETETAERLHKLGLGRISNFISMPRSSLRRRFGQQFIKRLDQALGIEEEVIHSVEPVEPYQERLPCLEPIVTATGIEIALQLLLEIICKRLKQEQKGSRIALLKCYRTDGKTEKIEIGTNRPSHNINHLFRLFELKISTIEPGPGIELFILEAKKVEVISPL
jgi:protein ImuB